MRISFITANYVAREVGFHMTEGWMQGDKAANDHYRPIDTYAARLEELLALISDQGYDYVDFWTAHLHWSWATPAHIETASMLLAKYGLTPLCYGGYFGDTIEEFTKACATASAAGMRILAGSTAMLKKDRAAVVAVLHQYDCKLAIENHPGEKTPADILQQIGDGAGGRIGTALDTGWWGTQGYDSVAAIHELYPHILTMHLKDVLAAGAHDTCRFGKGVVPIEACVRLLAQKGYTGPLAVEHEPDAYDPTPDCIAMRDMITGWLA